MIFVEYWYFCFIFRFLYCGERWIPLADKIKNTRPYYYQLQRS
uniref:Uncharacterized protein n=1 Tax=Ciona intestinalis TaxID=7719 RepID=H2XKC4_CIOIN